jgi:hypothetical protein
MKTLSIALSIALFLGLSALTVHGLQSASAQCADQNEVAFSLASGSVTLRADNTFDYTLLVSWNTKGKPFMGQVELDRALGIGGSFGVSNLSMSPTYFFPSACSGDVAVHITGKKTIPGIGWVSTKVSLGPSPNNVAATNVQAIR